MNRQRLTAPDSFPVTVKEIKDNSLIVGDHDNDLLEDLIAAAVDVVESDTGRSVMPQVWKYSLDAFPSGRLVVPLSPIRSVEIKYLDSGGELQTLAPESYDADLQTVLARIDPLTGWPATHARMNAVQVIAQCGYADADAVPGRLKRAIKMLVGHWYENREASTQVIKVSELPMAYELCLSGLVVHDFWSDE